MGPHMPYVYADPPFSEKLAFATAGGLPLISSQSDIKGGQIPLQAVGIAQPSRALSSEMVDALRVLCRYVYRT